jgi:hypothetical protein
MDRFFLIRLTRVEYEDLHALFNFTRNIPYCFDKYYVLIRLFMKDLYKVWYEAAEFGVHDLNHDMLGVFTIRNFSKVTLISFYIEDNKYRQAFIEYIQWIIEEMKLVDFTILKAQGFGEDPINVENNNLPYVPKTEAARDRWRRAYTVIQDMRNEAYESDDLEIYIPKLADFRDRIKQEGMREYDKKTISYIINAGDKGLLN